MLHRSKGCVQSGPILSDHARPHPHRDPPAPRVAPAGSELQRWCALPAALRVPARAFPVRGGQGTWAGTGVLVRGKGKVLIVAVEQVGQYAVKLVFDDGHDTGLYTWQYLAELGREYEQKWARYLERCAQAAPAKSAAP